MLLDYLLKRCYIRKMVKRRELTAEELQVAQRAKSLWLEKKRSEGLTQEDANNALGWSQSAFGQYINGRIPFNLEALIKISGFLGVRPADLDPKIHDLLVDDDAEAIKLGTADDMRAIIDDLSGQLNALDRLALISVLVDQLKNDLQE